MLHSGSISITSEFQSFHDQVDGKLKEFIKTIPDDKETIAVVQTILEKLQQLTDSDQVDNAKWLMMENIILEAHLKNKNEALIDKLSEILQSHSLSIEKNYSISTSNLSEVEKLLYYKILFKDAPSTVTIDLYRSFIQFLLELEKLNIKQIRKTELNKYFIELLINQKESIDDTLSENDFEFKLEKLLIKLLRFYKKIAIDNRQKNRKENQIFIDLIKAFMSKSFKIQLPLKYNAKEYDVFYQNVLLTNKKTQLSLELFKAAEIGNLEKVQILWNQGARITLFNKKYELDDHDGVNALFIAARNGHKDIVAFLLNQGVNVDLPSRHIKLTPLGIALYKNHKEIVRLLISSNANVNYRTQFDKCLFDYIEIGEANDKEKNELRDILFAEGAIPERYTQNQDKLTSNYNLLVSELKKRGIKNFSFVNNAGICDGSSKLYILKDKENRSTEFKFFIQFINSLEEKDIIALVDSYKKNKHMRIPSNDFKISETETINQHAYSFNKLINFMEGIHKTQESQFKSYYKSIGANWDASNIVTCDKNELGRKIKKCELMKLNPGEDIQYRYISSGNHAMALIITSDGADFFDTNRHGDVFCKNEEELAFAILLSIKTVNEVNTDQISFAYFDLSYGNKNREFDDLINQHANYFSNNPRFQKVITLYKEGAMSRRDSAYALFKKFSYDSTFEKVRQFKEDLLKLMETGRLDQIHLDNVVQKYSFILSKRTNLKYIIDEYKEKTISVDECAAALYKRLSEETGIFEQLLAYLKAHPLKSVLPKPCYVNNVVESTNNQTFLRFVSSMHNLELIEKILKIAEKSEDKNTYKENIKDAMDYIYKYDAIEETIQNHVKISKQINSIIKQSHLHENDSIALKISKLFYAYAHPPFFSVHWRKHRTLANEIANTFRVHPEWDAQVCKAKLVEMIATELNEGGTFRALLKEIDRELFSLEEGKQWKPSI